MKPIPTHLRAFGWNERILTLDDFYRYCEQQDVIVFDAPMRRKGLYFKLLGWHFIVLSSRLRGIERALVAWHEVGHYCFHFPGAFSLHRKTETEANMIAHVALIPVFLLNFPDGELWEMFGYDPAMVKERSRIFDCFNE